MVSQTDTGKSLVETNKIRKRRTILQYFFGKDPCTTKSAACCSCIFQEILMSWKTTEESIMSFHLMCYRYFWSLLLVLWSFSQENEFMLVNLVQFADRQLFLYCPIKPNGQTSLFFEYPSIPVHLVYLFEVELEENLPSIIYQLVLYPVWLSKQNSIFSVT